MTFTDHFIKRPVLATVISILILGFGIRSMMELPLRKYPKMEIGIIRINTSYSGTDAETIQSFITNPIERTIASADGIDYVTSDTSHGSSTVNAFVKMGYSIDKVFTDIMSKVAEVKSVLPEEADSPVITKSTGRSMAMMLISLNSPEMNPQQITDYFQQVMRPKLETIEGVSQANVFGGSSFAMRIWIDPNRMAALNITPEELNQALHANQFLARAGTIEGHHMKLNIKAETDVINFDSLQNLTIRKSTLGIVRLRDIARVELGASSYEHSVSFNGKPSVFIAIDTSPTANPLNVIKTVKKELPALEKQFPPSLSAHVVYDATTFIEGSIKEVIHTIIEATIIVLLVIFLFIGNLRAVMIPMVTIPLSLIGVASFMLMLGYSINFLTLLAMVLAIGLVVDDAIVVLENIHRHLQKNPSRLDAAIEGAREIAAPVITMTLTLAAVYTPIGFVGGVTGALFKEFAFTLASCVILSGIIALTLTPMMCFKIIDVENTNWFETRIHETFEFIKTRYRRLLSYTLEWRLIVLAIILLCFAGIYVSLQVLPKELAPNEDENFLFVQAQAPQYANYDYVKDYSRHFEPVFKGFEEIKDYFVVNQSNSAFAGAILKPWNKRKRTPKDLQPLIQKAMLQNPGLRVFVVAPPSLPIPGSMMPIQFVVSSTIAPKQLAELSESLKQSLNKTGLFAFLNHDLEFNKPSLRVLINRDKAAMLGVSMQHIAQALSTYFSATPTNRMQVQGKSYDIIPMADHQFRLSPENIKTIHVKSSNGKMVPLSTLIRIQSDIEPNKIHKFQQLNAVTLSGIPAPGHSIAEVLDVVRAEAERLSPPGTNFDYSGESRRYIQEGHTLAITFLFALAVIFLVLSAQFESFITPFIILLSVPLTICGAVGFIAILSKLTFLKNFSGASTLNIYSQIGLISLIGLISKHGILMVEFANKAMLRGENTKEAITLAATTRLRPILMTTLAMVLGVMPLIFAEGPGSMSRISIGLVLASGLSFGTLLTLFVIPTVFLIIRSASFMQCFASLGVMAFLSVLSISLEKQHVASSTIFMVLATLSIITAVFFKKSSESHREIIKTN